MRKPERVVVVGAGAWGTALASVVASNGTSVVLWGRDKRAVETINRDRENARYLPGVPLPESINAVHDLEDALKGATVVLLVTPVATAGDIGAEIIKRIDPSVPIICCSKGIDPLTEKTPSQTLESISKNVVTAVLSGPSFAADVSRGLPTAVVMAARNLELANRLSVLLSRPRFRIYAHDDVRGVELGGALKNVVALAVGVCRGLKLGASAEAAVIARGFDELARLMVPLGGHAQTLAGLSGMGDLVLSCSSEESRNLRYGMALGCGKDLSSMPLAEGARTVGVAARIVKRHKLDCPIIEGTARLIQGDVSAQGLIEQLLLRPLKHERAHELA